MSQVSVESLRQTVIRMEAHIGESEDQEIKQMMDIYRTLSKRFPKDLQNERDELLCRSAVLMLIQEVDKRQTHNT